VPLTIRAAYLSSWFCCVSYKYAFEDFAIRQVALLLKKTADEAKYFGRSLVSSLSLQHSCQGLSPDGFGPMTELQECLGS
jgi:hypothetical protein